MYKIIFINIAKFFSLLFTHFKIKKIIFDYYSYLYKVFILKIYYLMKIQKE
jgi:hypothetical protein